MDHSTINRWVVITRWTEADSPLKQTERLCVAGGGEGRAAQGSKVQWKCLYRAVDSGGNTLDFSACRAIQLQQAVSNAQQLLILSLEGNQRG